MGAIFCCLRLPSEGTKKPKQVSSSSQKKAINPAPAVPPKKERKIAQYANDKRIKSKENMTLYDCLLSSPALNPSCNIIGSEIQARKQVAKRVHPSCPVVQADHFCTPRISFSSEKLAKIDERDEHNMGRSAGGKLKKKVSFKLPDEGDIIIFYSPREEFEEGGS